MRLSLMLSVPYRLAAETGETASGQPVIRLTYPELADCWAEGIVLEDVLSELDRKRMTSIAALVAHGAPLPIPRPPLLDCDPLLVARDLEADHLVVSALEQDRKHDLGRLD